MPDNKNHALADQLPGCGFGLVWFARIIDRGDHDLLTKHTAILIQVIDRLQRADFLLLTDGQSNAGAIEPLEAANLAEATGVRIYTIGVGGSGGGGGLFGAFMGGGGLDESTLRRIALRTGGQYFRAGSQAALRQVYATIDELETTPAEVTEISEPIPWYRWILAPGVLLLLIGQLLSATVLRRGP